MRELIVFAGVGLTATFTHYCVVLLLVEYTGVTVLWANVVAYCCAVGVSFFGHSMFTFRVAMSRNRLLKFIVVSLSALAFSQALLAFLTARQWFDYKIDMGFVVLSVPVLSYVLNKFWVYRI